MRGVALLAFPLLLLGGFTLAFLAYRVLFGPDGPDRFQRHGLYVYVALLLAAMVLVFTDGAARADLAGLAGAPEGRAGWWLPLWVVVAAAVGGVLFALELWGTVLLRNLPGIRRLMAYPAMESQVTEELSHRPRAGVMFTLGIVIVVCEESLWRGYLVTLLDEGWGLSALAAVVLAAIPFGLNHLYFGGRAVAFKAIDGVAWGALLLVTGTLLAPLASHFAFNAWAWRRLAKGAQHDPVSDTGSVDQMRPAL